VASSSSTTFRVRRSDEGDCAKVRRQWLQRVCVNLYYRESPDASFDDAAAAARASGGCRTINWSVTSARRQNTCGALANSNQKVGSSATALGATVSARACSLNLDAAVDCYGAFVVESRPESTMTRSLIYCQSLVPAPRLFGIEDQYPSPEQTVTLRELLTKHGKDFTFHEYDGAGHAFFAVDRPSYRARWRPKRGARFGSSTAPPLDKK